MTRRPDPPPLEWRAGATPGVESARLDEHGTTATLARTPGGYWWQVYWPPGKHRAPGQAPGDTRRPVQLARASRQGNAADRAAAIEAAHGAYGGGRP